MKAATIHVRNALYCYLVVILISITICSNVYGQTCDDYIDTGEDYLLEFTTDDIINAYNTFKTAHDTGGCSNDSVVNTYLAITRILNLFVTEEPADDGLKELLEQYGFTVEGNDYHTLNIIPPKNSEGATVLPETSPTGEAIRSFLGDSFVDVLDASIANFDTAVSNWDSGDKYIIDSEKLDTDADIEYDYGDLLMLRAYLKGIKCSLLIVSAYDLNVDVREVLALDNAEMFNFKNLIERYEDFLKLLPTTTTTGVNGTDMLVEAKSALQGMIDDLLAASTHIKNDTDTEVGAEELLEIDDCELREEAYLRNILEDARDSLTGGTSFQIVEDEETWLFTGLGSSDYLQVILEADKSGGYFTSIGGSCDFMGCGGEVSCITIDGTTISIELTSYQGNVTFTGTLNGTETEITGGSYEGNVGGSPVSGSFSAGRVGDPDIETTTINLNNFFGGNGPNNLRDLFPQYNDYDDSIYGTAGHGLGDDATLDGIFPDYTQDDWDYEDNACGEFNIPVVADGSIILDGDMSDWSGITVFATDIEGDGSSSYTGSDIGDFYLAKDSEFLYMAITLNDGAPNQSLIYTFGNNRTYDFDPDYFSAIGALYVGDAWIVSYQLNESNIIYGDYAVPGSDFIEYKFPLSDLEDMSGHFANPLVILADPFIVLDYNNTCIQLTPTPEITGTLTIPGYTEGPVYLAAYKYKGSYDFEDNEPVSYEIIYPGDYTAGMAYSLGGIGAGEEVYMVAWWDADTNGHITSGDHYIVVPAFTVDPGGNVITILDQDGDGLSNALELSGSCTEYDNADTDGDGIPDGVEDANRNGVQDTGETDPCNDDSDSDEMPDGWEVQYGLEPLVDDADGDPDQDGFSNLKEYKWGSDPEDPDSHPPRAMPFLPLLLDE